MNLVKTYEENIQLLSSLLPVNKSFDVIARQLIFGGKKVTLFFVDGFTKDEVMERILSKFLRIDENTMNHIGSINEFIELQVPYIEVDIEKDVHKICKGVLSGTMAIVIQDFDEAIMLDVRTYPARGPQEPDKEKVIRGSRDGLVETIVFNTALIRRRIRDESLVFEMSSVGTKSKTDVVIGYMEGIVNEKVLQNVKKAIENINVDALALGEQSLVEAIVKHQWYNPFPKVRFTERPDVAAAHILEGKVIVIVDNSPNALILPVSIFEFLQDVDEYYNPPISGNLLRWTRNLILLATLFIIPIWLVLLQYLEVLPPGFAALAPREPSAVPLVIQVLILEIAIDGLKLASLNTPGSLGMSLSVVGALILGEASITTGWFVSETVLYMAVVALGTFAQPNVELGYALKYCRMFLVILIGIFGIWHIGIWGFGIGLVVICLLVVTNPTISGAHYLYPLYPFNGSKLLRLLVRVPLKNKSS